MIEYVDPFPGRRGSERVFEACGRCGGTGFYNAPTGITWTRDRALGNQPYCLYCGGSGQVSILVSSARATERRRVKAANEAEAQAARFAAQRADFEAAYGALVEDLRTATEGLRDGDRLKRDAEDLLAAARVVPDFAEDWAEAVRAHLGQLAERESAKRPVPTGRVEIEGRILATKLVDGGRFGYSKKMLVEGDGWKVWGSVPSAVDLGDLKGLRVRFTATVEAAADDPSFGFFTRPSKAQLVD